MTRRSLQSSCEHPLPEVSAPSRLNVEAEQALLGAIFTNNEVLPRVVGILRQSDFGDPLHGRIYGHMNEMAAAGKKITSATMIPMIRDDPAIGGVGGFGYLARLAGAAISLFNARDYAETIREAAARRDLDTAALAAVTADAGIPADQVAAVLEAQLLALSDRASKGPRDGWIAESVARVVGDVAEAYQSDRRIVGVSSGLATLDRITGGWRKGRLIVLGGRPSMGKSAIAVSFALAAARSGVGVLFASLEMSPDEVAVRMISNETVRRGAGAPYVRIQNADLREADMRSVAEAAQAFADLPIRITGPDVRDIGGVLGSARKAGQVMSARGTPLGLVIVDYIQIMTPPRSLGNKVAEVSDLTAALKAMARSLDVPVIALSQLSRGVEQRDDKRPMLSDLRESGSIEQDADQVMFAFREEYYIGRKEPRVSEAGKRADWEAEMAPVRNTLEIGIPKNRQGAIGTATLFCAVATNTITDLEEQR